MFARFFKKYSVLLFLLWASLSFGQNCTFKPGKRVLEQHQKALSYLNNGQIRPAKILLTELAQNYPTYAQVYVSLGIVSLQDYYTETSTAEGYFKKALSICADSCFIAYYYLGRIHFGQRKFPESITDFEHFLNYKGKASAKELSETKTYLTYARVSADLMANPVPFRPVKVEGISSQNDEYLPIISPDNEFALYTRRRQIIIDRGFDPHFKEIETFTYSLLQANGKFNQGTPMPYPFNQNPNEGAPSLTIDNNDLYYTLCVSDPKTNYLNCDLMHSHFNGHFWSEPKSIGTNINSPNTWESQPSVDATGQVLYFASNRQGGLGGYDLYKCLKQSDGSWSNPINLGPNINTAGHEKSPFIHSDSQTLYFSSDGIPGLGGFDIFYSRMDSSQQFGKAINIGYPINSFEDDLGFFVSTDGNYGYYASNRFDENKSWNLYHFPLYEKAKPQQVLFIKGNVKTDEKQMLIRPKVEIHDLKNRTIKEIPVDSVSGKYVAVILFRNDQLLTVKKEGFVTESRYISTVDSSYKKPATLNLKVKPIEVGKSYKINDIYFAFNSAELTPNSLKVIQEFYDFLQDNPRLEIEIQGHTDNIGTRSDNQILSEERAKAVYNYLLKLGTEARRITYKGYGEDVPVADNETTYGRSQNRRTVFLIVKK